VWDVDEPVLYRFGYTENSPIASADGCVRLLVEATSKNGGLLLNISPKADGTIPDDQQKLLLQIGAWLDVNGAAIYGTRPWTKFGEDKIRFTTKGKTLYAITLGWPGKEAIIPALAKGKVAGKVEKINLLGHAGALEFSQDESGLQVTMPDEKPCDYAFALEIAGLEL
jgi:alpha-L-fucosidase